MIHRAARCFQASAGCLALAAAQSVVADVARCSLALRDLHSIPTTIRVKATRAMRITLAARNHPRKKLGGAEYQTWLLGKGLTERGHAVTFVATESGNRDSYADDVGIQVIEIPGWETVGRNEHATDVRQAIDVSQPQLVYVRSFPETYYVAQAGAARGIPLVTTSCHYMETSPLLLGYGIREAVGHIRANRTLMHLRSFYAIRGSTAHVCIQHGLQESIERWYPNKRIQTVYNGLPVPESERRTQEASRQVIWVNNIKRWKRPEIYIELARHLPDFRFLMVGRKPEGRYGAEFAQTLAAAPPNLDYIGPMPVDEANDLIAESDLLMYTSLPVEGFGNSFVQAWFRYVPTVSYEYEMDGIIEREDVGRCARNFDELVAAVKELMLDDKKREQMGVRARQCAENHFSDKRMVDEYEALFADIIV